jgi:manganese/iron transport system permease protein
VLHSLLEPFQYTFMTQAMVIGTVLCALSAWISCYLILKGWALMGDAVSHAIFPGVVLAYIVKAPLVVGAFLAGLLSSLSSGWLKPHTRVKEDTLLGIIFTGMFALGLVMFSKIESDIHLNHILFGNILGLTKSESQTALGIAIGALICLKLKQDDFITFLFDPHHAKVIGLPLRFLRFLFFSIVSLSVVATLQAVGVLLTVAMLIIPGCTAFLLVKQFHSMVIIAICSAALSAVTGTYISFFLNGSSGACIVLVQSALFVAALGAQFALLKRVR